MNVKRWNVRACNTGQRMGGFVPCEHSDEPYPATISVVLASDHDAAIKALTAERDALKRKVERVRAVRTCRANIFGDVHDVVVRCELDRALADEEPNPHRCICGETWTTAHGACVAQPSEMGRSWFCPCCKCHDWVSAQPSHGYGKCDDRHKR